jgi:16S rRNA (cytosine967-C5)-methyltransferase
MESSGAKVRAVAAEIVDAVAVGGRSLDAAIKEHEQQVSLDDRSLLRMLCYGSLRNHWQLQAWISQLVAKPLRKRDSVINALLAVGLYQFTETRIPDHAVVSETVAAARVLRRPKLAGLVNACLRRFIRDDIKSANAEDEQAAWNHPQWLIDSIKSDWPDDWRTILAANNEQAPMWLRANSSRNSAEQYIERLTAVDIDAEKIDGIDDAVRLKNPQAVEKLPGFAEGDASVQDAAAQIAARWLMHAVSSLQAPIRLLDACAAPGGKSGHILELGKGKVSLVAVDNDESRLASIADNLNRIGCNATIIAADASNPKQWWDEVPFDGILLDAPCSASGVIRRHPDIKLLRRESDLHRLAELQYELLKALWPLLAPGGTLLYVTCSVGAAENDEVTGRFLAKHGDAIENDVLPNNNIRDLMRRKACGYQILPGSAGLDGFYYAALQKKKVS